MKVGDGSVEARGYEWQKQAFMEAMLGGSLVWQSCIAEICCCMWLEDKYILTSLQIEVRSEYILTAESCMTR